MTKSNKIKLNDCYLQIEKQRASYLKTCTLRERKHVMLELRRVAKSILELELKRLTKLATERKLETVDIINKKNRFAHSGLIKNTLISNYEINTP